MWDGSARNQSGCPPPVHGSKIGVGPGCANRHLGPTRVKVKRRALLSNTTRCHERGCFADNAPPLLWGKSRSEHFAGLAKTRPDPSDGWIGHLPASLADLIRVRPSCGVPAGGRVEVLSACVRLVSGDA